MAVRCALRFEDPGVLRALSSTSLSLAPDLPSPFFPSLPLSLPRFVHFCLFHSSLSRSLPSRPHSFFFFCFPPSLLGHVPVDTRHCNHAKPFIVEQDNAEPLWLFSLLSSSSAGHPLRGCCSCCAARPRRPPRKTRDPHINGSPIPFVSSLLPAEPFPPGTRNCFQRERGEKQRERERSSFRIVSPCFRPPSHFIVPSRSPERALEILEVMSAGRGCLRLDASLTGSWGIFDRVVGYGC